MNVQLSPPKPPEQDMSLLYDYRIFSLVISIGSGLAVFVQGMETLHSPDRMFGGTVVYAQFGIATAVLTTIPLALILLCECIQRPVDAVVELACLPIVSLLWLAVGAVSTVQRRTNHGHASCESLDPAQGTPCTYADFIAIFSFVPGAVLMLYTAVLALVAWYSARVGKPVWRQPVRGPGAGGDIAI
ncbi:hypothetical protein BD413DRAFT_43220 [Trametes elegans]|nr:hypothetical protein BD413DRAFT_43220 [Trametes elegans]